MLFELDNVYNFSTISKTVLKSQYRNLRAVSYLGFRQAVKYSGIFNDVVTAREQIAVETKLDLVEATKAKYVLFEDEYGNELLFAEDWIKTDSIQLVSSIKLKLIISDITTDDQAIILNILRARGYKNIHSEIVT